MQRQSENHFTRFQAALSLAKSPISAIMRDFIGGSPRMVILSNGSGAEASSPLGKTSAEGQARHPIHTILFPQETGFFIIKKAA